MCHKTVTAILLGIVFCTSLSWAGNPNDYIIPGRAQLFDGTLSGVRQAYQTFTNGINDPNCSNNRKLRFLHAVAGTAMLAIRDDGGSIDSFSELASEFGIEILGDNWHQLDVYYPLNEHDAYEIPPGVPDGDEIRSIIDTSMIPQINSFIVDLDLISDSAGDRFRIFLDPNETRVFFDPNLPGLQYDLEVDYGEVLLLKGFLTALKGQLQAQLAYDLYVDPNDKLAEKIYNDCFSINTDLLDRYPHLLKVLPTVNDPNNGAVILALARQDLIDAIDYYFDALDYIRNETDSQEDDLLYIDPNDEYGFKVIDNRLTTLRDSLANDTVGTYPWETTKTYDINDVNGVPIGQLMVVYDFTSIEGDEGSLTFTSITPSQWEVDEFGIDNGNELWVDFENYDAGWRMGWLEATLAADSNSFTAGTLQYQDLSWNWVTLNNVSGQLSNMVVADANVDFNPIFGSSARYPTPVHPRDLLPEFDQWNGAQPGTMGHDLGDDPTLGGILPNMTQDDWRVLWDDLQPGGLFVISSGTATIDGSISEWTASQLVLDDISGDTERDPNAIPGMDIDKLYLAYDPDYLYGAITLYDNIDNSIDYTYELIFSYSPDDDPVSTIRLEIRVSGGSATSSLWYLDNPDGYPSWVSITGSEAVAGLNAVEFKIPLANIPGGLPGRFLSLESWGWNPSTYEWYDGEWNGTHLKIEGLGSNNLGTISGTITYDDYSGAPIFVQAYTESWNPEESLVASTMIDAPGAYTLTGIGIGFEGYVRAFTPLFGFNVFDPEPLTVEASTSVTLTGPTLAGVDLVLGHPTIDQPSITIPIEFGETISGSIDPSDEVHIYTFSADVNDTIYIRLTETIVDLELEIRLYSPDGTLLESRWTYDRLVVLHTLPDTGVYSVLVCDHLIDDTGSYGILVQRLNNPGNATPINFGDTISGSIDAAAEIDTYTLSATTDDTILISMNSSWGSLDPEVRLFTPDGIELAEAHNYGNTVAITHVLPDDGQYTVLACDHSGTSTGGYTLSLSLTIFERLTLGDSYVGDINTSDWHLFSVDVEADRNLLVTLEPLSSTGTLELYGRHGQAPTPTDYDYATKNKNTFGNYELLITPTTSGTYYFGVYGGDIAGTMSYRITASIADRHVSNIYPQTVNTSAEATVHIVGMGFTSGMQVELRRAGAPSIQAERVTVSSPGLIIAQFDLSTTPSGQYDISVIWPDDEEKTFEAVTEVKGLPQGALYVFDVNIVNTESQTYDITVPDGVENLFITLQKTTLVGYGYSWGGTLSLLRNGGQIASTSSSHDLILHIVNPASDTYAVKITGNQTGSGILTVWDALPELPLGDWVVGKIYCSYGSVYYQVQVPPDQDTLYFEAEGMGLWSHFDIYYGQYGGSSHWVSPEAYDDRRTSIEISNPAAGLYIVEFMDSAMIYTNGWSEDQSRDVLIKADTTFTVEPPPNYLPTITSLSTDKGGNTGLVTVEIKGGWLDPNAAVSLVRIGYEDIIAQTVSGDPNRTTLTAAFDLRDKEPGEYNLTVTNPDGQSTTAPSPFTIEESREPELWMEIVGREKIRVRRPATYIVRYGNKGNVQAWDCYVIIKFSPGGYFKVDLPGFEEYSNEYLSSEGNSLVVPISILPSGSSAEFTFRLKTYQTSNIKMWSQIISLSEESPSFDISQMGNGKYATYYPPRSDPPVGAILYWNLGEVAMHTGIYLGDGKIAELNGANILDLIKGCEKYTISETKASDRFSDICEGVFDAGYFGAWTWPGYTVEEGQLVANKARARLGETGTYTVLKDNKPFVGKYKNCNTFVYEVLDDIFQREGIRWYSNPRTTFMHLITLSPYPEKYAAWPTTILMKFLEDYIKGKQDFIPISPMCTPPNGKDKEIEVVDSMTPEDKYGPTGFDPLGTPLEERERFVPEDRELYYKVDFWNKEDATAPACDVLVKDELESNLEWNSFRFEKIGFLKWDVELEPCQYFNLNVDTRPDMDLIVNVEGTFDLETGEITWTFRSLDPATMETPEDPMAGFLPPITETGEEVGWVAFSAKPKDDLLTGTQIGNQAFVEFDWAGDLLNHPAPKEGPWINTIDASIPTSNVLPLPETTETRPFLVEWSGQDDLNGSGIHGYDIYVSTDSNDYVLWIADTNDTSETFIGEGGHTYSFYSRAHDNVGHVEPAPDLPDSTTTSVWITGDFCGANFGPEDGYVDVWDLMQFADCWHCRHGEPCWDPPLNCSKFDLGGPNFGAPDGYIDVWDLMVFADNWHKGQKP